MDKVDEGLIFDNADGNEFQQCQQRQTEMIVAKFTQLPHHYIQVPHSQWLQNSSTITGQCITVCITQKLSFLTQTMYS